MKYKRQRLMGIDSIKLESCYVMTDKDFKFDKWSEYFDIFNKINTFQIKLLDGLNQLKQLDMLHE